MEYVILRKSNCESNIDIRKLRENDTIYFVYGKNIDKWFVSSPLSSLGNVMLHNDSGHVTWVTQEQLDKICIMEELE